MHGPRPSQSPEPEPEQTEEPRHPDNRAGRRQRASDLRRSAQHDPETAELLGVGEELRGPRFHLRP